MLTRAETESLLSKLCIELGFCLPPEDDARLIESPPDTVEAFTDAVFIAEGLNPEYAERHLYRQVRDKVAEAFQKHLENDNVFDD
jgi:hypothetical protein